jgi:hypothetical protein
MSMPDHDQLPRTAASVGRITCAKGTVLIRLKTLLELERARPKGGGTDRILYFDQF